MYQQYQKALKGKRVQSENECSDINNLTNTVQSYVRLIKVF